MTIVWDANGVGPSVLIPMLFRGLPRAAKSQSPLGSMLPFLRTKMNGVKLK